MSRPCGGVAGGPPCANRCIHFSPSALDPSTCDCGHRSFRHGAPQAPATAPSVIENSNAYPGWTSFLLALGGAVAVSVPVGGIHPPHPNLIQLHRATTQPYWPAGNVNLDGSPLPSPTLFGADAKTLTGSRIFIRPQYRDILHELVLARREHQTEFFALTPSMGGVIAGNSGVGKTTLLFVRMHFILQPSAAQPRPTIVLYHQGAQGPIVVRLRGAPAPPDRSEPPRISLNDIHYATSIHPFLPDLNVATTHFLIDLSGQREIPTLPSQLPCLTLAALSPGLLSTLKQWIEKQAYLVIRYLSGFTRTEADECRQLVFPSAAERTVAGAVLDGEQLCSESDNAVVQQRYTDFGGIARSLFNNSAAGLVQQLEYALQKCSLKKLFDTDGELKALDVESSMLLHYQVFVSPPLTEAQRRTVLDVQRAAARLIPPPANAPTHPTLPFMLLDPPVEVPTFFLKESIYQYAKSQQHHAVVDFLKSCIGHTKLAKVRGDLFEPYAHEVMKKGGQFWVQQLNINGGRIGNQQLTAITVAPGAVRAIRAVADIGALQPNEYGQPVKETWPTLDAVIHPNITLQFTVSSSHSVKSGGLFDAEQQLHPSPVAAPAPPSPPFRVQHYFCVPRDQWAHCSLHAGDFEATPGKPLPCNVDYWVLLLEEPITGAKRGAPDPGGPCCDCSSTSMCKKTCPCANANPRVQCAVNCSCTATKCKNRH